MTMIYQQDSLKLDAAKITEEKHPLFGDMTVFHDVVIASEIVQPYSDGNAWKPRDELEAYAWTVDGRWVMVGAHPEDGIISDRNEVAGRTINPRYVKDLKDPTTKRPCRAGVKADIQIFNNKVPPQMLDDMKNGKKQDVSIGFFYTKDETAGVVESDSCKGQEYDYVQRNLFHDHLAAGIDKGRCPMPFCGLGADEITRRLTGDPFAGFKDFSDCVSSIMEKEGVSEESAKKICGKLKSEHEDNCMEDALLGKSKEHLLLLLEEAYEELRGTVLSKQEKDAGDWWRRVDWKTASDEAGNRIYDSLSDETKILIIEAGLCPDCQDEKDECEEGYEKNEEGECVKMEEEDVLESNPGFSPGKAEQECPEGMEWNAEKMMCVKIENFSDEAEEEETLTADSVLARFEKVMKSA